MRRGVVDRQDVATLEDRFGHVVATRNAGFLLLEGVDSDDALERDIELFLKTSGQGRSESGWKFNRDEIYEERLKWPVA